MSSEHVPAAASSQTTTARTTQHRVTLISKPDCHLCVLAKEVVGRVADELGVAWEVQDITQLSDPDPMWWEQVPVTLIDGQVHDYWRVNERRLREALTTPTQPA